MFVSQGKMDQEKEGNRSASEPPRGAGAPAGLAPDGPKVTVGVCASSRRAIAGSR